MTTTQDTAATGWSVRGRLTLWMMTGALALVVLSAVFSFWGVKDSLRREMQSLAVEEIAELSSSCITEPMTRERFEEVARSLNAYHPEFEIRSRAWSVSESDWIGDGGGNTRFDLPADAPAGAGFAESVEGPYQYVKTFLPSMPATDATDEGVILELLIDGGRREASLARTASLFLSLTFLIALAMVVGGFVFSSRLARLLSQVAESARSATLAGSTGAQAVKGAPREIRAVVDAFQDSVSLMQDEHARNVLMTAGLAHELRSPLHNMMTEAEVALLRPRAITEYRDIVGRQLREMKEFALVVDNLITITALRDTKRMERKERFDLGDEAVLRLQREEDLADQRDIEVVVQRSGDLAVAGDREALILMLRNLVGNAIRWTPPGTHVTVTMEGTADEIRLFVDDEGPGIPAEERERVFNAFHQGATPNGRRAGYGLGLALARAATDAHGGTIRAEEAPTGGARLAVYLPRSSESTPEAGAAERSRVA